MRSFTNPVEVENSFSSPDDASPIAMALEANENFVFFNNNSNENSLDLIHEHFDQNSEDNNLGNQVNQVNQDNQDNQDNQVDQDGDEEMGLNDQIVNEQILDAEFYSLFSEICLSVFRDPPFLSIADRVSMYDFVHINISRHAPYMADIASSLTSLAADTELERRIDKSNTQNPDAQADHAYEDYVWHGRERLILTTFKPLESFFQINQYKSLALLIEEGLQGID